MYRHLQNGMSSLQEDCPLAFMPIWKCS